MPPYFELKVEMYSYLMTDNTSSTHAKLVKTFSKAVGKAVAKTLKETDNQVGELFITQRPAKGFLIFTSASLSQF